MDLKKIGLVILTFIVLACAVQAATNSYSFVRTTTADMSTSAQYQTCTVSSDKINFAYSSTDYIGRYVSSVYSVPNATVGSYTVAGNLTYQDAFDVAWIKDNTYTLNSSDYRHVTGGHAFYQIRYTFDKAINSQIEDMWFTSIDGSCSNASLSGSGATFAVVNANYPDGYYMNCDGVDDFSRTTYAFNYTGGYWTHALMVYPTGTAGGSPLGISDAGSYAVFELQIVDSGSNDYWQLLIRDQNIVANAYGNASAIATLNAWHCVIMTADGTNVYVYDNGVKIITAPIKQATTSVMDLDYIQVGGIYYAGANLADFTGRIDEYRFLHGTMPVSQVNPTTSGTFAKHMWNCDNYALNNPKLSYRLDKGAVNSGNLYFVSNGRCRDSGSGFTIDDYTMQITNTAPVISAYSPLTGTEQTGSITLSTTVHDADLSYITPITTEFYLDGVSQGTGTRTTDGAITKNVGLLYVGSHNWSATVYDPWSGSTTLTTKYFTIPGNLTIRDEENYDSVLSGSTVTLNFYTDNISVSKNTNTGILNLTGLPSGDMLVTASADGYISRKTIIFDIFDTNSIYLLNESADIIYQKFVLNTQTISGSPTDYILKIQKPMNGTVNTVFSSYFDFDGVCGTYLIESDVYQLVIIAPDGTESTYGYLYPDPDGQIDIAYEGISFNEYVNAWLVTNTSINKDTKSISFAYDEAEQTSSLNPISVTEATMIVTDEAGTQVYNVTVTDSSYVFQYIAASEGRYTVNIDVTGEDEDGQEFSYTKSFPADFIDDHFQFMPDEYPDWLKMLVITFLCILLLVSFGGYRSDLACGLSFGLYAFSAYQEWISVSALALGVLFIIVMAAFFKLQRKEGRRG